MHKYIELYCVVRLNYGRKCIISHYYMNEEIPIQSVWCVPGPKVTRTRRKCVVKNTSNCTKRKQILHTHEKKSRTNHRMAMAMPLCYAHSVLSIAVVVINTHLSYLMQNV